MISLKELPTVYLIALASKFLAVIYGILTFTQFEEQNNLNLMIISSYISTLLVLTSGIAGSRKLNKKNDCEIIITRFNSLYSICQITALQIFVYFLILITPYAQVTKSELNIFFLIQTLHIPFLVSMLSRNEQTYFTHNRIYYLLVSFTGNLLSLSVVSYFVVNDLKIDSSLKTLIVFLLLQLIITAVQNEIHFKISHKYIERPLKSKKLEFKNAANKLLTIKGYYIFMYLPFLSSFILFLFNSRNSIITTLFITLNLMTLIAYIVTPEDRSIIDKNLVNDLKGTISKILYKSLIVSCLISILFVFSYFNLSFILNLDKLLTTYDVYFLIGMLFLGIFLVPIILIENSNFINLETLKKLAVLSNTTLIFAFILGVLLFIQTPTYIMLVTYLCAYLTWYFTLYFNRKTLFKYVP
jgi:hypothetical protein